MRFRWNQWNVDHIAKHGVSPEEAEDIVENPRRPFPRYHGNGKYLTRGQTGAGRWLQVIYVFDPAHVIYVIHARPLKESEKRSVRRSRR
jgi:uncharacterized DUF497 family protein